MQGIENYFAFMLAGILLNLTPGSDTIYVLTRSVSQGKKAGIYSSLGISTGGMIHTFLAAFGLSMILSTSAMMFNIVKYAGACYLGYLGLRMLMDRKNPFEQDSSINDTVSMKRIYWQGVLTNVLNPKVAIFFLSFLPQFIDKGTASGPLPFLLLGATFNATGTIWCLLLAWSSSRMTKRLRTNKTISRVMKTISGTVFIGLGLKLAFKSK